MTTENFVNIFNSTTGKETAIISAIVALGVIVIIFMILIFLALYIYISIALMSLAKKTKTKHAWMAWIPILNFYLITQIAKQNGLWTLILLAWFIPLGTIAVIAIGVWMFWMIAERRKLPGWFSLLLLIPIVNLVILGIMAWKKR